MRRDRLFIHLLLIVSFSACFGPEHQTIQRPDERSVAFNIGEQQITTGDVLLTFQETREFTEFLVHAEKGSDAASQSPMPSADIKSATTYLQSIATEIAFETMLAKKAKELDLNQSDKFLKLIEDALKDELYQKVIIEDVLKQISINDEDVKRYYQQNRQGLYLKDNTNVYKVRGIYVFRNQQGRAPDAAKRKIEKAYQALESGEPFASVSRRYSEAPVNMRGVVNPLPVGSAADTIEQQLKLLSEGEYSPIFEFNDRLYIFELVEFVGPVYLEFDKVKNAIILQLFNERRNELVYSFSQRLQSKHNCLSNEDILQNPNEASADTILLSVPGVFEVTINEFLELAKTNKKWTIEHKTDYLHFLANKASCLAEAYDRGWTEVDVEKPLTVWKRKRLADSYLIHEAESKLPPESEIKSVYDKNYGHPQLSTPKYFDIYYLFLDAGFNFALTSFESSIRFQNAEGKALAALREIETGRPFSEVALFYSNDEASMFGKMERIPLTHLGGRMQSIIGNLEAGEVSKHHVVSDIQTNRYGIEVFYIESIEEPRPYTFEEAKSVLSEGFIGNQYQSIRDSLKSEFFAANDVTINPDAIQEIIDYLRFLSEKPDRQVDITYYAQTKKTN